MTYDEPNDSGAEAIHSGVTAPGRLSPERAREILAARFAAAGLHLAPGVHVAIDQDGTSLTLDGYDANRAAGYIYYDADPNDPQRAETAKALSRACADLAASGQRHILFIFQDDMPTSEVLERRIDAFFVALSR